ncbi:small ribosomal subunit protein uS12m [Dermacentor albipictus]|uniref:small ribosomal subunit protein uS12m n=1 Tax=Dermacentor albipictus TaxID=60249 RepID=UPI0038FD0D6F
MNSLRSLGNAFAQMTLHATKPSRSLSFCATTAWQGSLSTPYSRQSSNSPAATTLQIQRPSLPTIQPVRHKFFVRFKGNPHHDGLIYDPILEKVHAGGIPPPKKKRRHPLDSKPFMKGVVIKTLIKKPKKPNSANRKCVLVRLSNGKEATAYVPGVGHNLQEHSVVLVYRSRTKDVPGLKLKVVRGKYDCAHVIRKPQSGS